MNGTRLYQQFPAILENVPLDPGRGWWCAYVPSQKVNLCQAPSFERYGAGADILAGVWQITSGFLVGSFTTDFQTHGARSLQILPIDAGVETGASTQVSCVAGTRYTFSFDLRAEVSDYRFQMRIASGTSATPSLASAVQWKEFVPDVTWKRFSLSFVAQTTGVHSFAIVKYAGTGLHAFWIDGVQVEEGEETSYIDGDMTSVITEWARSDLYQPQFYWTGEPHASPSVRTQYTTAGGKGVKFSDYGWMTKSVIGLGTPTFLAIGTPYATVGGSEFKRVIPQEREFTLVGRICGDSYETMARRSQALQSLVAPVVLSRPQPIVLEYQPTDECDEPIGCPIQIDAVYTGGFTGNITNRFQQEVSLNFKSFDPFVRTGKQQGTVLSRSRAFPYITTRSATGKWIDRTYNSAMNSNGVADIIWGLDGALYMLQYTTNFNLALKRLRVGQTTWETLQNIQVFSAGIKIARMAFSRDWKLWVTGYNFADETKKVGYYNLPTGTFVWSQPAGLTVNDFGMDIVAGYNGEVYVAVEIFGGNDKIFRHDSYITPTGWKAWGEANDTPRGLDVARDGTLYVVGEMSTMTFNGVVTGGTGVFRHSGNSADPYELLGEGLTGTGIIAYDVVVGHDGAVYIVGDFDGGDGIPEMISPNFIKWNGTHWESLVTEMNANSAVYRVWTAPDNTIYISGNNLAADGIQLGHMGVYRRGAWKPFVAGGGYVNVGGTPPVVMAIHPQSGDFALARNLTGSSTLPAYTNVASDMTAPSRPTIKVRGEGTLYSIVNHSSQGDVRFQDGFYVFPYETVTIDLTNLRAKVTSDVRGDLSQFLSMESRLGSFRIMPGNNEVEVHLVTPSGATAIPVVDIFWDIRHASIDAAINCSYETLPIPASGRVSPALTPEGQTTVVVSADEGCWLIAWDEVESAAYYEIEYYNEGLGEWVLVTVTDELDYVDCDIFDIGGTIHTYRVRAVFEDDAGVWNEGVAP